MVLAIAFNLPALMILLALLSFAYGNVCREITKGSLGSTTSASRIGLLANFLRDINGHSSNPLVQVIDINSVCLSQGHYRDRYGSASVVVKYTENGVPKISQIELTCTSKTVQWYIHDRIENDPVGDLETPTRTDCLFCMSPRLIKRSTDREHCFACQDCDTGLRRCNGFINKVCCLYFNMAGSCVTACPTFSSTDTNFNCVCNARYEPTSTRSHCKENIRCNPNPCKNGGNCIDVVNGYSCTCAPGYTGSDCRTNIDECHPNPCKNGGTCSDRVNAYSCACGNFYTGTDCRTSTSECYLNPCENGGTCTDQLNNIMYSCSCAPGYTGTNCRTNIDECDPDPCVNGGVCNDLVDAYSCACYPGYTDSNCATNIDDCNPDPCRNGGGCIDRVNAYTCVYISGYTDANCATKINECDPDPCLNGGTCTDRLNAYRCACVPGYTNHNCATNINECDSNPCEDGLMCHDLVNKYFCEPVTVTDDIISTDKKDESDAIVSGTVVAISVTMVVFIVIFFAGIIIIIVLIVLWRRRHNKTLAAPSSSVKKKESVTKRIKNLVRKWTLKLMNPRSIL